jgi:hypothetical protein
MRGTLLALATFLFLSTALGGCALITLEIDVKPDLSADFTEKIRLDKESSRILAFTRENADDFWTRIRKLAKARGWKLKEKSANILILSGHYPKERVAELGGLLGDQLASVALDYGARSLLPEGGSNLIPSKLDVKTSKNLWSRTAEINYDIDLSTAALSKRVQIPEIWGPAFSGEYPDPPDVRVIVKTPFDVVKTNGKYDASTGKVSWKIDVGKHNQLFAAYRIIEWMRIGLAALAAGVVLTVVALLLLRSKKKAKENADNGGDVGIPGGKGEVREKN